jgi:plasmid maintenance system antidote protein VapI
MNVFLNLSIYAFLAGKRSITAEMNLQLCRFFDLPKGYRLRAQAACDNEIAGEALAATQQTIRP